MQFKNRVAVITGASRGIGREISKIIAENGGKVCLVARSVSKLQETKKLIEASGGEAEIFPCDLSEKRQIDKMVSAVLRSTGGLDFLVNNAGVWHNSKKIYYGPRLDETPENQIREVVNVGILAPMLLSRRFLPSMIKKRQGKILNISGAFEGVSDAKGWLHYYVSKKAVEHFSQGLAQEVRKFRVQVNCISPWFVATDPVKKFFPDEVKSAITPREVAELALLILSKKSNNLTGQILEIPEK